ncbi:RidA family protein [Ampullimonas aquatilis]|uniref:RidA family protein n=1 Tax=Ampullimonas aquatilis TaxID=1341549 RepID=UPI003C737A89
MIITRHHVGQRFSEVAIHNGTVYLAGQIAERNPNGYIAEQTAEVLEHVDRLLAEAGSDKACILQATIYLASMDDYAGMNAVWDAWVAPAAAPPRATVQAQLAHPDWRVEMVIVAAQRVD